MYNHENPGIRVKVNFENLVEEIILAPNSSKEWEAALRKDFGPSSSKIKISRSKFE